MLFPDNEADQVYEKLSPFSKFIVFMLTPLLFALFVVGAIYGLVSGFSKSK